jgi:hypothetical protein
MEFSTDGMLNAMRWPDSAVLFEGGMVYGVPITTCNDCSCALTTELDVLVQQRNNFIPSWYWKRTA